MITLDFVSFAPRLMTLCILTTNTDTVMNQKPTGKTKIHLCIHLRDEKNSSTDGTPLIQSIGNITLAFMLDACLFRMNLNQRLAAIKYVRVDIITCFFCVRENGKLIDLMINH